MSEQLIFIITSVVVLAIIVWGLAIDRRRRKSYDEYIKEMSKRYPFWIKEHEEE